MPSATLRLAVPPCACRLSHALPGMSVPGAMSVPGGGMPPSLQQQPPPPMGMMAGGMGASPSAPGAPIASVHIADVGTHWDEHYIASLFASFRTFTPCAAVARAHLHVSHSVPRPVAAHTRAHVACAPHRTALATRCSVLRGVHGEQSTLCASSRARTRAHAAGVGERARYG
ncbi:hypothetical protein EON67_01430, partial [archaeon]